MYMHRQTIRMNASHATTTPAKETPQNLIATTTTTTTAAATTVAAAAAAAAAIAPARSAAKSVTTGLHWVHHIHPQKRTQTLSPSLNLRPSA